MCLELSLCCNSCELTGLLKDNYFFLHGTSKFQDDWLVCMNDLKMKLVAKWRPQSEVSGNSGIWNTDILLGLFTVPSKELEPSAPAAFQLLSLDALAPNGAGLLWALTCICVSCLWHGQRSQTTASFGVNWPYLEGSFSKTAQTLSLCFGQLRSTERMDLIPQKSEGKLECE